MLIDTWKLDQEVSYLPGKSLINYSQRFVGGSKKEVNITCASQTECSRLASTDSYSHSHAIFMHTIDH